MTTTTAPVGPFTVTWPTEHGSLQAGTTDLADARSWAHVESRGHGHATITNRAGHVETWVAGQLWTPKEPQA